MTSKYHDVVYGNYDKTTTFPRKLVKYLLDNHWPKSSKYKSYQEMLLSSSAQSTNVLDVGCGDNTYLEQGFWAFHDARGIDCKSLYKRRMGMYAKGKIGHVVLETSIDFNKDALPYEDDSFDIVFTKSTIEHIHNTDHFLKELLRVLKPGGLLIVLLPSWEHNWRDFYNDYTHVKPFHRKGLQDALKINGFKDVVVDYHYHLPWVWDRPWMVPIAKAMALLWPFKWRNREQNIHRPNIRFSQEVQLLGVGTK
jgi:SAM-dependent methyltransferase